MKTRKTPAGLIIGLLVVGAVIFGMNVMEHRESTKAPVVSTEALQDTLTSDLKQAMAAGIKQSKSVGAAMKLPGNHAVMSSLSRNPQNSMLMKPAGLSLAQKAPKPKSDFSGGTYSHWYDQNSGVPKS